MTDKKVESSAHFISGHRLCQVDIGFQGKVNASCYRISFLVAGSPSDVASLKWGERLVAR